MTARIPEIDNHIADQAIIGGEAEIKMMAAICKRHGVPLNLAVQYLFEAMAAKMAYALYRSIQNPLHYETVALATADKAAALAHAHRGKHGPPSKPKES